jgi:hypothetical protein
MSLSLNVPILTVFILSLVHIPSLRMSCHQLHQHSNFAIRRHLSIPLALLCDFLISNPFASQTVHQPRTQGHSSLKEKTLVDVGHVIC